MLPPDLQPGPGLPVATAAAVPALAVESLVGRTLAEIEQIVIEATITAEDGSVPRAAKVLGVSPSTLYRKREGWLRTDAAE
jgi:DNA-binding NtrC family response regulator